MSFRVGSGGGIAQGSATFEADQFLARGCMKRGNTLCLSGPKNLSQSSFWCSGVHGFPGSCWVSSSSGSVFNGSSSSIFVTLRWLCSLPGGRLRAAEGAGADDGGASEGRPHRVSLCGQWTLNWLRESDFQLRYRGHSQVPELHRRRVRRTQHCSGRGTILYLAFVTDKIEELKRTIPEPGTIGEGAGKEEAHSEIGNFGAYATIPSDTSGEPHDLCGGLGSGGGDWGRVLDRSQ